MTQHSSISQSSPDKQEIASVEFPVGSTVSDMLECEVVLELKQMSTK